MADNQRIPFDAFEVPAPGSAQVDDIMLAIARGGRPSAVPAKRPGPWLYGGLAAATAAVLVIAWFALWRPPHESAKMPAVVDDDAPEHVGGKRPAPEKRSAKQPSRVQQPPAKPAEVFLPFAPGDMKADLSKARRAAMNGKYGAALLACTRVLARGPNTDANAVCLLASCALKSQDLAAEHFENLPEARKAWATQQCKANGIEVPSEPGWRLRHPPPPLSEVRRAAMSGDWKLARFGCESILEWKPGNTDARSICLMAACNLKKPEWARPHFKKLPKSRKRWAVQQCKTHGIDLSNEKASPAKQGKKPAPGNVKEIEPTLDIKGTVAKARRAALRGDWKTVTVACERVLSAEPKNSDARTMCLMAACNLKQAKKARAHYGKLSPSRQSWAVQQCFSHGIELQQ